MQMPDPWLWVEAQYVRRCRSREMPAQQLSPVLLRHPLRHIAWLLAFGVCYRVSCVFPQRRARQAEQSPIRPEQREERPFGVELEGYRRRPKGELSVAECLRPKANWRANECFSVRMPPPG